MRIAAVNLLHDSGPITLSTTWTGPSIFIGHAAHYSMYLEFSGVPEGTFVLEYSNDIIEPTMGQQASKFAVVIDSEQIIDEAGTHGWSVENAGYRWVRAKYQYTAGVGVLGTANFHSKGV